MATDNHTLAPGNPRTVAVPGELVIYLDSRLGICEFLGTSAMLEAEGLVQPGGKWPHGYGDMRWRAGHFDYWLRRQRPTGAKGPRRAFADCDWWCLRLDPVSGRSYPELKIRQMTRELAQLKHSLTPMGIRETNAAWNRYAAAKRDDQFQSFFQSLKAACGIEEKRRGRTTNPQN